MMAPGGLAAAIGLIVLAWSAAAAAADRLDRLRALLGPGAAAHDAASPEETAALARSVWTLADEEVLENLRSGLPFASVEFIQERLDLLAAASGAVTFRVQRVVAQARPAIIGAFGLSPWARGTVRVYGPPGAGASLLQAAEDDGVPEVVEWPSTRRGEPQWAVAWSGVPADGARRPARFEIWRLRAAGRVSLVWTSAAEFPDGLWVSRAQVGAGTLSLRYAPRYPGWKPGCVGQVEQEDLYRYDRASDRVARARRETFNAWHRELHAHVARLFGALAADDRRALAVLVPDETVRARLPRRLTPEPACDALDPDVPGRVVVAATEEAAAGRAPWSLSWARVGRGWRLAGAAPVLD